MPRLVCRPMECSLSVKRGQQWPRQACIVTYGRGRKGLEQEARSGLLFLSPPPPSYPRTYPRWFATRRTPWQTLSTQWWACPTTQRLTPPPAPAPSSAWRALCVATVQLRVHNGSSFGWHGRPQRAAADRQARFALRVGLRASHLGARRVRVRPPPAIHNGKPTGQRRLALEAPGGGDALGVRQPTERVVAQHVEDAAAGRHDALQEAVHQRAVVGQPANVTGQHQIGRRSGSDCCLWRAELERGMLLADLAMEVRQDLEAVRGFVHLGNETNHSVDTRA